MKSTTLLLVLALSLASMSARAQVWGGGGGGSASAPSSRGSVGTVWSLGTTTNDIDWNVACGTSDILVMLAQVTGVGTRAAYSTDDGVTWATGSISDHNWNGCVHTGTIFVAVGTGRTATSSDGITWTSQADPNGTNWLGLAYGGGLIVATAYDGTTQQVMTSTNGTAWTLRTTPQTAQWFGVAYIGSRFTAVAGTGATRCMHSTDAITWTLGTCPASAFLDLACTSTRCVAVGDTGAISWSSDGITYTAATGAAALNYRTVTYCGSQFIAVSTTGTGNRVATSLDGKTWTQRTSAADQGWAASACAGDVAFAVSNTGTGTRVMTSR